MLVEGFTGVLELEADVVEVGLTVLIVAPSQA
jgi:hypothetical protein